MAMSIVVISIASRQLRTTRRYPISMLNTIVLMPLLQLTLPALLLGASFLVGGDATGLARLTGTSDLAGWLILGMAVGTLTFATIWETAISLNAEREQGTLEFTWTCPVARETITAGMMVAGTTMGMVTAAMLVGVGYAFSARYSAGLAVAPAILAILFMGLGGYAYLAAGVTLSLRRANSIIDGGGYLVMMLSGAGFPVPLMPPALRAAAYVLPTTWAIDLIRHYAVGSTTIAPTQMEWLALCVASALLLLIGRAYYRRIERRLCTDGTVGQH
jgi:ABC-2 type transport system permease protein